MVVENGARLVMNLYIVYHSLLLKCKTKREIDV